MNPDHKDFLDDTKNAIQDYVETKSELIKLEVAEAASKITAALFSTIIIMVLSLMLLVFLSLMLGYYFSFLFNSHALGFGLIAGIYLILLLLIVITRKQLIERPIIDKIIRIIFDQNED